MSVRSTPIEQADLLIGTLTQTDPIQRGIEPKLFSHPDQASHRSLFPSRLEMLSFLDGNYCTLLIREAVHTTGPMRASASWLYSQITGGITRPQ